MRIAMIVGTFPAVSETFVLWKIAGLLERGHDVRVLAERPGDGWSHEVVGRYGLADRVDFARPAGGHLTRRPPAVVKMLASDAATRGAVLRAMNPSRIDRLGVLMGGPLFAGLIARCGGFDVLSAEQGMRGGMAVRLRRMGVFDAPVVTAMIGRDCSRQRLFGRRYYGELFAEGELLLPVADRLRADLLEAGASPDRTVTHRLPIPLGQFAFAPLPPVEPPLRLLSIGRLVEKKGFDDGIRALAQLRRRGLEAEYRVVGGGALGETWKRLAEREGVADAVSWLGPLPQSRVAEEVRRSHLVLVPSKVAADGDTEGLPNVVNEALACGRPVVATRHAGIPEVVVDNECGKLCDEADPAGLANAVEAMWDARSRWPDMAEAGRRRVEAMFDYRRVAERAESLYEAAVKGPPFVADAAAALGDHERT